VAVTPGIELNAPSSRPVFFGLQARPDLAEVADTRVLADASRRVHDRRARVLADASREPVFTTAAGRITLMTAGRFAVPGRKRTWR
jgi:hypothetical protein